LRTKKITRKKKKKKKKKKNSNNNNPGLVAAEAMLIVVMVELTGEGEVLSLTAPDVKFCKRARLEFT
jgi:hypothetical protein